MLLELDVSLNFHKRIESATNLNYNVGKTQI